MLAGLLSTLNFSQPPQLPTLEGVALTGRGCPFPGVTSLEAHLLWRLQKDLAV